MRKCKKNISLIFGYSLIFILLFIPCKKIYFDFPMIQKEKIRPEEIVDIKKFRDESKKNIIFFPFYISRIIKYEKFKKIESSIFTMEAKEEGLYRIKLEEEIKKQEKLRAKKFDWLDKYRDFTEQLEPEEEKSEWPDWFDKIPDLKQQYDFTGLDKILPLDKKELVRKEPATRLSKFIEEKRKEFINKFGGRSYYYKFNIEILITEIVLVIYIGGFAYILFCVLLRKPEKHQKKKDLHL